MNDIGLVPIILWAAAFLLLLSLVSYSSLTKSREQMSEYLNLLTDRLMDLSRLLDGLADALEGSAHAAPDLVLELRQLNAEASGSVRAVISNKEFMNRVQQAFLKADSLPHSEGIHSSYLVPARGVVSELLVYTRQYRSACRAYNTMVSRKPSSYIALLFGFKTV